MSCILYKLASNVNYEKYLLINNDSINIGDFKRDILKKKFERASTNKRLELDLEITNADTGKSKIV